MFAKTVDHRARMLYTKHMIIDRNTLTELLHNEVLTVTFIKKDGTERVMHCTLREDLIPTQPNKKVKKKKKTNDAVMPVYDIDAGAFRSFRLDSIKEYPTCLKDE